LTTDLFGKAVQISSLDVTNLRILRDLHIEPASGINFIVGANGSGKTSVLEAIYLAGRGRTFRHSDAGPMIRHGAEFATVFVELFDERSERRSVLGVQRARQELHCRLNGQDVRKRSILAEALPVLWVGSQPQAFLEMGPAVRRGFVDMGLFHVEPSYLQTLGEFQRTLRQRNAAIRDGDAAAVRVWNRPLAIAGELVDRQRAGFVHNLWGLVEQQLNEWEVDFRIHHRYRSGWRADASLLEHLEEKTTADRELGYTSVGPQRAELQLRVENASVEKTLSRGQQKILVLAANLALLDIIVVRSHRKPVLLIDDLAAELDTNNRRRVVQGIERRRVQAFLTEIEEGMLTPSSADVEMFHVEQGALR
jgi:DNA replication and repair protein RecF